VVDSVRSDEKGTSRSNNCGKGERSYRRRNKLKKVELFKDIRDMRRSLEDILNNSNIKLQEIDK
jgi:hypothetical protein